MNLEAEPKRKPGRPRGSGKYNFDNLQPGDDMDVPYEGPNTSKNVLTSAKAWARTRGMTDARFATMTYRTIGVVRLFRRR